LFALFGAVALGALLCCCRCCCCLRGSLAGRNGAADMVIMGDTPRTEEGGTGLLRSRWRRGATRRIGTVRGGHCEPIRARCPVKNTFLSLFLVLPSSS